MTFDITPRTNIRNLIHFGHLIPGTYVHKALSTRSNRNGHFKPVDAIFDATENLKNFTCCAVGARGTNGTRWYEYLVPTNRGFFREALKFSEPSYQLSQVV